MNDDKMLVEYTTADGSPMKLTATIVKRFLVSGRKEYVNDQELAYFLGTCKARKLNPFIRDCYLVKYSQKENAAILTSVDYYRKLSRRQPDCQGWQAGIIVKTGDKIDFRPGSFMLEEWELVGGWCSAKPKGWEEPYMHTVNLKTYIKKTHEGKPTAFWQKNKQPDMIMKVAEAQCLRRIWGEDLSGMYIPEEMPDHEPVSAVIEVPKEQTTDDLKDKILRERGAPVEVDLNKWNPYTSEYQQRYGEDKIAVMRDILTEAGVEWYKSWPGAQLHEAVRGLQVEPEPKEDEPPMAPEDEELNHLRNEVRRFWKDPETRPFAEQAAQEHRITLLELTIADMTMDSCLAILDGIAKLRHGQ